MKTILGRLVACFCRPVLKPAVPEMLSSSEYVRLDMENPGYQSSYPESFL